MIDVHICCHIQIYIVTGQALSTQVAFSVNKVSREVALTFARRRHQVLGRGLRTPMPPTAPQWPACLPPPRRCPPQAACAVRGRVCCHLPASAEPSPSPERIGSAFAGNGPAKILGRLCPVSLFDCFRGLQGQRPRNAGFRPALSASAAVGAPRVSRCS